jgi:signal transduction histidine kinase
MIALPRTASLRVRLLVGSAVWILVALTVSGVFLADLFRRHVEARTQAELLTHLDQLTALVELDETGRPRLSAQPSDPRLQRPYSGLYWQVDTEAADGVGVLRSRSLWDVALTVPSDQLHVGQVHVHRVPGPDGATLVMSERLVRPAERPEATLRLIVAVDERTARGPVREFVGLLAAALSVLGAGLLLSVLVQVSAGLAPLRGLRGGLAAVREGRARRLDGAFPSEVQPLVDDFNAVLAHDAEVVARARTQAGNLAHAVKTPLAVLANAAAGENGAFGALVLEQVATARRQVDYHLARARAAAAVQAPGAGTPLRPAVEGLLRVMARVHPQRDLSVDWAAQAGEAVFRGEEQDLQEMLGNLLDNACKWSARQVVVRVAAGAGRLTVTVDDDGPGLAPEARSAVFVRGVRADEAQPGSGLGLGIASELAQLYGGSVTLDAAPGGGLRATLVLPAV